VSAHLRRETERLKRMILSLSARVEESVQKAARSISQRDPELAREIVERDPQIDQFEVEVEEDCLKILALHQPVAVDLRFLVAIFKINNDLERIGDLAVNIAERALFLSNQPKLDIEFDFHGMTEQVQDMLRKSLDAMVNMDTKMADEVRENDEKVDAMNSKMYDLVRNRMTTDHAHIESLLHTLSISRHLERIADHATNIAEDVIYMVKGEIVRHRTEQFTI
jgi:phosphate transport system protein